MGHENVRSNATVFMDTVYLDRRPVLQIADEATRLSATRFLSKMTTEGVWDTIVMYWSSIYAGLLNTMVADEAS